MLCRRCLGPAPPPHQLLPSSAGLHVPGGKTEVFMRRTQALPPGRMLSNTHTHTPLFVSLLGKKALGRAAGQSHQGKTTSDQPARPGACGGGEPAGRCRLCPSQNLQHSFNKKSQETLIQSLLPLIFPSMPMVWNSSRANRDTSHCSHRGTGWIRAAHQGPCARVGTLQSLFSPASLPKHSH